MALEDTPAARADAAIFDDCASSSKNMVICVLEGRGLLTGRDLAGCVLFAHKVFCGLSSLAILAGLDFVIFGCLAIAHPLKNSCARVFRCFGMFGVSCGAV